jgi:hypothetical protein
VAALHARPGDVSRGMRVAPLVSPVSAQHAHACVAARARALFPARSDPEILCSVETTMHYDYFVHKNTFVH